MKYLYALLLVSGTFLMLWSFCTVGGSSLALSIPYNITGVAVTCENSSAFHHHLLPEEETCRNAYYCSLFLFAVLVLPLSALGLRGQAIFQVFSGLVRFLVVFAIILYSIANIIAEESADASTTDSLSNYTDTSEDSDGRTDIKDVMILKFDLKNWLTSTQLIIFPLTFHHGISALTHPIRAKEVPLASGDCYPKYCWHLLHVCWDHCSTLVQGRHTRESDTKFCKF